MLRNPSLSKTATLPNRIFNLLHVAVRFNDLAGICDDSRAKSMIESFVQIRVIPYGELRFVLRHARRPSAHSPEARTFSQLAILSPFMDTCLLPIVVEDILE